MTPAEIQAFLQMGANLVGGLNSLLADVSAGRHVPTPAEVALMKQLIAAQEARLNRPR